MKGLKMFIIKKIGLHPYTPRWMKMYCLNVVMRQIGKDFSRLIDNMTPAQRDQFNAKFHKNRMEA